MKQVNKSKFILLILLLLSSIRGFSQVNEISDSDEVIQSQTGKLLTGMYVGSYFANKYTASTYNGYGFDIYGNRNTFLNSFMYQKIKNEYGGGYGQYDQIADAIGVDQHQWEFNESDMPFNMRYIPAILVGFNFRYATDKNSAFLFNVNGTKLGVEGNFTITTLRPALSANPVNNNNIKTFAIKGGEQRLQFQLGFQRILGDDDKLNFFVETGLVGTLTKFDKNVIYINNLQIDLTYYVNQTFYQAPGPTRKPVGFGLGAFAGLGAHLTMSPKFTVQLLYTPSFEKANIGTNPKLKLQNAIGLRAYYNFRSKKKSIGSGKG